MPDGSPYPIGVLSIDQFFKVVMNLNVDQKPSTIGIILPSPRDTLLQSYLESLSRQEVERLEKYFADRGARSLQDGQSVDVLF